VLCLASVIGADEALARQEPLMATQPGGEA
jgi:hypothetical protein